MPKGMTRSAGARFSASLERRTQSSTQSAGSQEGQAQEPEDPFALERGLINLTKFWAFCDQRVCRRARCCAIPAMPCEAKHREAFVRWKRRFYIPYLRKRWPTVHWGAPAGQVQLELAAAEAAEAAPKERAPRKRRHGRKRRRRRSAAPSPTPPTN
jgi:hypothetical protein